MTAAVAVDVMLGRAIGDCGTGSLGLAVGAACSADLARSAALERDGLLNKSIGNMDATAGVANVLGATEVLGVVAPGADNGAGCFVIGDEERPVDSGNGRNVICLMLDPGVSRTTPMYNTRDSLTACCTSCVLLSHISACPSLLSLRMRTDLADESDGNACANELTAMACKFSNECRYKRADTNCCAYCSSRLTARLGLTGGGGGTS